MEAAIQKYLFNNLCQDATWQSSFTLGDRVNADRNKGSCLAHRDKFTFISKRYLVAYDQKLQDLL